jgi:hypothetical protein
MNRRTFLKEASAASLATSLEPLRADNGQRGHADLTVENFRLNYSPSKGWTVGADSLKLQGLSFPASTWGWVALNIAQGALAGIGGMIFSAIANALFSSKQPDIADLLRQQLIAFAHIIEQAFDQHDLMEAQTSLTTDLDLMSEYVRTPHGAGGRVEHLIPSTAHTLRLLERLNYAGYQTYIQAAGLRLALLQDLANRERGGAEQNFTAQQTRIQSYHDQMISYIVKQTEPATHFDTTCSLKDCTLGINETVHQSINILGHQIEGEIVYYRGPNGTMLLRNAQSTDEYIKAVARIPNNSLPAAFKKSATIIDWLSLRRQLFAATTDFGAPIISKYMSAKPVLVNTAARNLSARWS